MSCETQLPPTHKKFVVTLIHGTFAPRASWTCYGSTLRRRISEHLGGSRVVYKRFEWGGWNGPRARARASRRLIQHVKEIARDPAYSDHTHVLIAHSHGGNICQYALRDPEVARLVKGVVCMSTPFIHAQPRDIGELAPIGLALVAASPLVFAVADRLPDQPPLGTGATYAVLFAAIAFLIISVIVGFVTVLSLYELAKYRLATLSVPKHAVPMLLLRTVGDEASGALLVPQLASFVLSKAYTIFLAVPTAVAVVIGVIAFPVFKRPSLGCLWLMLMGITAMVMLLFIATVMRWFAVAGAGLTAVAVVLNAIAGFGFGATSVILEITAETTPPGSWAVHNFAPRREWAFEKPSGGRNGSPKMSFLAHSAVYQYLEALDFMAEWISNIDRILPAVEHRGSVES